MSRTFPNDQTSNTIVDPLLPPATALADLGRGLPLFDISAPELGTLATRLDCLIPSALPGDAEVAREEEVQDQI
jgi:hypothetical protein